jgi:GNAT superfamily N-acetyltransferase
MSPDLQPEFRLATTADAELLLGFMREYYAFDGHHYDREAARAALLGLLKNPVFGLVWVILDSDTPVGYIVMGFGYSLEYLGRDAFIDEFYLIESYRGRGWGRGALEFACGQARLHHVRAIHLEVVSRNSAALDFYRKFGFQDHGHHLMSLPIS